MSGRIDRCRRCGAADAEAPDGSAIFMSRNIFGPIVERDLCAPCFRYGMWVKWRTLTTAISAVVVVHGLWTGQWHVSAVGGFIGWVWWMIAKHMLAIDPPPPPLD